MADRMAIWRGPFAGQTVHGGVVEPGDVFPVSDRDLESGHWELAEGQTAPEPDPIPEPTPVFPEPAAAEPTPEETA